MDGSLPLDSFRAGRMLAKEGVGQNQATSFSLGASESDERRCGLVAQSRNFARAGGTPGQACSNRIAGWPRSESLSALAECAATSLTPSRATPRVRDKREHGPAVTLGL